MSVAGRQRISWRILEPGNTHGAATVVISFDPTSPGELSGRASSYGSPDCYGREHYDDSDTKWLLNQRDCEDITPYDALVLGELNESFAPSTRSMSAHSLPGGQLVPRRGVVTSPNVS
ncbi:uncharacterized protein LACBIDRAFT_307550 [Laccaria bicolor S238N-H82]|uniref:Predicted protein n=1 Tax=Laccaria bicolor (strain S238N-H82 / ATCC MYA-4686) TaxID=486041 RepID=B0E4K8_LACBS|nr:uncharacterized protein LACBIDRAFT_307550 [Laccaria bicolor S238N-H82]EDQ98223.1 predicted protein [Laccaria bicolor S238N-H82]|eukprot:XP_001891126.1 predicted protein [Laccaria bicolor S238N-H82]